MRIRIATKAWKHSTVARSDEEPEVGLSIPWVEIDGVRTDKVLSATVEAGAGETTVVTLKFVAAVEMVLLNGDGSIRG